MKFALQQAQIQVLDLRFTNLREVPREIGMLHNLRELHLANNSIMFLPDEIYQLQNLEYLDISNNAFIQEFAPLYSHLPNCKIEV